MAKDILSQYYKGILGQLNSEVQLINTLFTHNGLKGEGNEYALRNLITKFIPNKYGIGSGVIIDRKGNQSRQCDIIIYDNHNYPELLSMSTIKFYPVDIVYAVIEVKTGLDSDKSKIAVENINSVLKLDYIKESFRVYPTDPIGKLDSSTEIFKDQHTTPPLGLVFSYETSTNDIETFLNWFNDDNNPKCEFSPSHVCSLDQGLLLLQKLVKNEIPVVFPLIDGDEYMLTNKDDLVEVNGSKFYTYKDNLYPYSKMGDQEILVDQGKTLLNFILILSAMLNKKLLSPNINLMDHYLTEVLKVKFTLENGKIAVF